ncbi:MAG: hypothetical protein NWE98_11030 [Candidatus Bathyarchaeota archaeon]|nr:hypothetical protein [Candidatus Bathyarchaeota archaeon]
MPRDRYTKIQAKNRAISLSKKPRFLTKPLRKCPSCRQDAVVEINIMSDKVVVRCRNCFLRYDFTKFPAFEEIDYYNKMLDVYRTENWKRKVNYEKKEDNNDDYLTKETTRPNATTVSCPVCKIGNLGISNYFAHGSQIIKCNDFDCHATFAAPKHAFFRISDKICPECGWPLLVSSDYLTKVACFNPKCKRSGVTTILWK